jgi:TniQ
MKSQALRPFDWTTLPPFPLEGVGTPMIESTYFYARRLEANCGLRNLSLSSDKERVFRDLHDPEERDVTTQLVRLTGVDDLRFGSFQTLAPLIRDPGLGKLRRWCPECYDVSSGSVSLAWHPLIWTIGLVQTCPRHNCKLEGHCRNCGATQFIKCKHANRLRCRKCRISLGGRGNRRGIDPFHSWADGQIADFLARQLHNNVDPLNSDACEQLAIAIERIYPDAFEKLYLARTLRRGSGLPLRPLINIAAGHATSIYEIVHRPMEALSANVIDTWAGYGYQPLVTDRNRDQYRFLRCLIRRLLNDETSSDYLPPLRHVLRAIAINRKTALELFAEGCAEYERARGSTQFSPRMAHLDRMFHAALLMRSRGGELYRAGRFSQAMVKALARRFLSREGEELAVTAAVRSFSLATAYARKIYTVRRVRWYGSALRSTTDLPSTAISDIAAPIEPFQRRLF